MYVKKVLMRFFFSLEMLVFCGVYLFGKQSITVLVSLQKENDLLQNQLLEQKKEIAAIEHTIHEWQEHPFYKEKIAREQLQMARKDEQVYYIAS